ncbi:MAG: hypothetical protein ILM98_01315 [Kiritimatiellae bacterium]|nr:hypothetical protein [Kiritimatiellia bacterium]
MSNSLIQTEALSGCSVYGVKQVQYTVDGVSGKDYAAALTAAAFKEAAAIEVAVSGYAEVVRQRIRKLEDLGSVMAALNYAVSNLKIKDQESGDTASVPNAVLVSSTAQKYGIDGISSIMTRRSLYNKQNEVQYAMDKEDNDLKQDSVSLNSYMSKRDNSFSTAAKLVKKASNASDSAIGNIG